MPGAGVAVGLIRDTARAPKALKIVGTGGRIPEGGYNPTGETRFIGRFPIAIGRDCGSMVLAFDNWWFGSGGAPSDNTGAIIVDAVALERGQTGQHFPVRFGAGRSCELAAGASHVLTTPVDPAAFGLNQLSRDEIWWGRVTGTAPAGSRIPYGFISSFEGAAFYYYAPRDHIDQVDASGVLIAPTGAVSAVQGFGPSAVLGVPIDGDDAPSVLWVTDSIGEGYGDDVSPAPCVAGWGYVDRAAVAADGSRVNTIATMHASKIGGRASIMCGEPRIRSYFKYATILGDNLGTNDAGTGGIDEASTIILRDTKRDMHAYARSVGVLKIIAALLWPRTSSSNGWADEAGQSYVSNWGPSGTAGRFAGYMNADFEAGLIDFLMSHAQLRGLTDPYKWRAGGTADGTHGSAASHIADGAELRTIYALRDRDKNLVSLVAAMTSAPDTPHITALNTLIVAAKAHGWWAVTNVLHVLQHSEEATKLNIKAPGQATLIPFGAPGWTPAGGYQGDGVDNSLSMSFVPGVSGDSLHDSLSAFAWTDAGAAGLLIGNTTCRVGLSAAGAIATRVNDGTTTTTAGGVAGEVGVNRTLAASYKVMNNGVPKGSPVAVAATTPAGGGVRLMSLNGTQSFWGSNLLAAGLGPGVSDAIWLARYNDILAYLTTVKALAA